MLKVYVVFLIALTLLMVKGGAYALDTDASNPQELLYGITDAQMKDIENKAYPNISAKWPHNWVFVCWENPKGENLDERNMVRDAIAKSWEKYSKLEFNKEWNACVEASEGIRIKISDTRPEVKYLGKYLAYEEKSGLHIVVKDGMTLNFTFKEWNQSCQNKRESCIRAIAIHEFGHAIGFAHEQNRPDTKWFDPKEDCAKQVQGPNGDNIDLTPWDRSSVMNYCNVRENNNGKLSKFDIKAVKLIYN